MPAQRSKTAVDAAGRPGWPQHAGVPSWGAVLIAVVATLAGFAIEAGMGHSELGSTFAVFYALGCLGAVLAVRQSGVFTAVIQPPLVLFVAVPTAYFLLHGSAFAGLKDFLISCGYPLIERFPLMLLTSAGVLLIGAIRWYLIQSGHTIAAGGKATAAGPGRLSAMTARLSALLSRPEGTARRPRHGIDRAARPTPTRAATARSRTARPTRERERHRASMPDGRYEGRYGDRYEGRYEDRYEDRYEEAPRPRRRAAHRPPMDADPRPRRSQRARGRTPPQQRREPADRRFEQYLPPSRDRQGYPQYQPYPDPYPPRRRSAAPRAGGRNGAHAAPGGNGANAAPGGNGAPAANGTHHPVSRVRYRGSADDAADGGRPRR